MKMRGRSLAVWCLALALTTGAGCGRKTAPIVPDSPRPETVKDLKAVARDAVVFVSWPAPARNVEGKRLDPADIRSYRVYRADFGRERETGRYRAYAEIDAANPAPAVIRNGMVFWNDDQVKFGELYGYRVRVVSARGWTSAWSDAVRARPRPAPSNPTGVAARAEDSAALLTWETVTTWRDGGPYVGSPGYNVYRGNEKNAYGDKPLNAEPLAETKYRDAALVNDKTYYYVVRSVVTVSKGPESPDSREVSATPRDMTPPDKPTGLTAIAGVGRVFLTWNENKENDLAGYIVYRSAASGSGYVRLTEKPQTRSAYADETGADVFYYVVTAVDRAGNESAQSEEKKAAAEAPH
jgi:hypothetical protein